MLRKVNVTVINLPVIIKIFLSCIMPLWLSWQSIRLVSERPRVRISLAAGSSNEHLIFRNGVVGNISACHADARGSIPRSGGVFLHNFCSRGLVGYDVRLTRGRPAVQSRLRILLFLWSSWLRHLV